MQKEDCFLVGTVFKLHGYKGDVKIYNEDDIPFNFIGELCSKMSVKDWITIYEKEINP